MPKKKIEAVEVIEELDDDIEELEVEDEVEDIPGTGDDDEPEDLAQQMADAISDLYDDDEEVLSAKQVATRFKTDARNLRKFLRSRHGQVGQGNRWTIGESKLPELQAAFEAWNKPKAKVPTPIVASVEEDDDETLDLDDIELID